MVVRRDRLKAVCFVEAHGFSHFWWKCVETHRLVIFFPGLVDEFLYQLNADLLTAKTVADIESFHLANSILELSHGDTAGELVIRVSKEQSAIGLYIFPGQAGNLLVKTLKAKTESEPRLVLTKQPTRLVYLLNSLGLNNGHHEMSFP